MANHVTGGAVTRLATRAQNRTEADIQSDIQTVLVAGDLNLDANEVPILEEQTNDGTRRRLDISICHAVIEVKKDLTSRAKRLEAESQLTGYLKVRHEQYDRRFVGILTDGVSWILYDFMDDGTDAGTVTEVARLTNTGDADRLVVWLEAILVSNAAIEPTPAQIEQRLGATSPGHLLDFNELSVLYAANESNPEVTVKRDLWAKLLQTAFGSAFQDDSAIFINHTLLVLTAEIIAHAVVKVDVSAAANITAADLVEGTEFNRSQIHGVVEADFFDWVANVPGGEQFIRALADRISRFDWDQVEHDVLKHLYESVITADDRRRLGEYYTPDWLAYRVINAAVTDPANQRILDPSCGSGTFIFHAIRAHLAAAEAAGLTPGEAVGSVTRHVFGMDIHPVSVTLARVTYLLAITSARLQALDRPEITVPVYLGDSLQWEQNRDLFTHEDKVSISTSSDELVGEGGGIIGSDKLVFPVSVLKDAAVFDRLVSRMSDKATDTTRTKHRTLIGPILKSFKITDPDDVQILGQTFATMRDLSASGRDHIWGYYVRNLIRPIWLAQPDNKVDVLVGNPPWLRYSKMTSAMKDRYKALAKPRNLLTGGLGAAARDLSTLFVARAIEKYLKNDGRFAFVMPHGTLTRLPHTGFRTGNWSSVETGPLTVAFGITWDLTDTPTGFPMVSCVITGTATAPALAMTNTVQKWTSTLKTPDVTWDDAEATFTVTTGALAQLDAGDDLPVSPYKKKFRQGAILVPRVLVTAEDAPASSGLGAGAGRRLVRSRRTTSEKKPWKDLDGIREPVEARHVHPVHLGETIAAYRPLDPILGVIPLGTNRLLTHAEINADPGLAAWWSQAEIKWEANKVKNDPSDLLTRMDYLHQLSSQLPVAAQRVVYTKAGTSLTAARIEDGTAIIDHKLYWAPVFTAAEGRYLTGILNSRTLLSRVTPLQNIGLFGPRDFDKNVFYVDFGPYDPTNTDHNNLVDLVERAEATAAAVPADATFKRTRTKVRQALTASGLERQIEDVVNKILPVITT